MANDTLVFTEDFGRFIFPGARRTSADSILRVTSAALIGVVIRQRPLVRNFYQTSSNPSCYEISTLLLPFSILEEVIIIEPKVETEVRTDVTEDPGGGITPTFKLDDDQRRVVINDWVKALKYTLKANFESEISIGSPWFRSCRRSAWWMDPKFTLMTEEEFKAPFSLDR